MIYSSTNEKVPLCDVTSPIVVRKINVCLMLFIVRIVKNCIIYLVFRMFIDISTLVKLVYHCLFFIFIHCLASICSIFIWVVFLWNPNCFSFVTRRNPFFFQFIVLFIIYIKVDTLESCYEDKLFPLLN